MSTEELFFMREPWQYDPAFSRPARPDDDLGFDTQALHAGFRPLVGAGAFNTFTAPIMPSMTFPYERFDKIPYPVYGRTKTPTAAVLEERLAALEGGEGCVTAGSGSQALFNLLFTIARPGDNVVTSLNIFGEGYKQAAVIFPERCGVQFRFVKDPADPRSWDAEIDGRTKLVWVETPSNPCLFVTDIRAVADVAHARGVPLLVDNTTATAALQQPLALGADIVLLSITKFLAGNATVIGGAIVGPEALTEDIRWNTTEFVGAIMPPFDSWLTLQYLETLSMRMMRHSSNAQAVAEYLAGHPKVSLVNYTGLAVAPAARPGAAADAGRRRADVVRRAGRHPRGGARDGQLQADHPRGDLRHQPHHLHAPAQHHARAHDPGGARRRRHRRRADPAVGRAGESRGYYR